MATYLENGVTQMPELEFTPDYAFLSKALNAQQERYNKGFSLVRGMYNSMLNTEMLGAENNAHRQEIFKKIQDQIKSISGLDLSQAQNVMTAQGVFDPLSKDREFIYDMHITKRLQKAMETADMHANSMDPEMRRRYSELSKRDIQYAMEDLKNAKRGDGSVFAAQAREFTPVDDIFKFLDERADKDNFKIKTTKQNGMYLVTTTNGEQAGPVFSQWASRAMGNQFDRQIDMEARVTMEDKIRSAMKSTGASRNEVIKSLSPKLMENYQKIQLEQNEQIKKGQEEIDIKVKQYEKAYSNGFPSPEKEKEYKDLLGKQHEMKNAVDGINNALKMAMEADPEAVVSKFQSLLSQEIKYNTIKAWGKNKAERTAEVDIAVDSWKVEQYKLKHGDAREDLKFQRELFKMDKEQEYKLELEGYKAKLEGKVAEPLYLGKNTDPQDAVTAVDVQRTMTEDSIKSTYDAMLDVVDHSVMIPKEGTGASGVVTKGSLKAALSALHGVAGGSSNKITPGQIEVLKSYAKTVGVNYNGMTSQKAAKLLLTGLAAGTYQQLSKEVNFASPAEKSVYNKALAPMEKLYNGLNDYNEIENVTQKIYANEFYDASTGHIKDKYRNLNSPHGYAKLIGRNADGSPIIETYNLSKDVKLKIEGQFGSAVRDQTQSSGSKHLMPMQVGDLSSILNKSIVTKVTEGGQDVTLDYTDGSNG
jgi:hypothetical protein